MKTSNVEPEEKKCSLYDMILIAESVKTPWQDLTEEQQKLWTPFVINRFISSREEYAPLVAMVEKAQTLDMKKRACLKVFSVNFVV